MSDDEPLRVVHPSWKNYFLLWLLSPLILPALIAIWLRAALTVKIYPDRVFISRGLTANDFEDVFVRDIRSIDVRQTFRQRIARIGDLAITTAGRLERTNVIRGLPNPVELKDVIIALRQAEDDDEESVQD